MKSRRHELCRAALDWFALVVIVLSVALFLTAYFLLYRAVQEQDREVVRAQLEVYRAWYAEGGLAALNTHFREREDSGKESFFVRVIGPQRTALFVSVPKRAGALDLSPLERHDARRGARLADAAGPPIAATPGSWPRRACPTVPGCKSARRPKRSPRCSRNFARSSAGSR